MKCLPFLLVLMLIPGSGCGKKSADKSSRGELQSRQVFEGEPQGGQAGEPVDAKMPKPVDGQPNDVAKGPKAKEIARKIKYTANLQLITEDFPKAKAEVETLVKEHNGEIAKSEMIGSPGAIRQGFWRVRIPVKDFDRFRAAIVKIAEVEKDVTDSEDVTEEYYDLENDIKNRKVAEEGLRKLLEKTAGNVENILAVSRELDAVRLEINRKQGRLNLLANLTDLTTVTITVREKQKYVPDKGPLLAEEPTFGMRIARTFEDSWSALKDLGQGFVIFLVAIAPWLPIILAVAIPAWIVARRRARSVQVVTVVEEAPSQPPPSA